MKTNEREESILSILKKQRFASVSQLAGMLYISPSSIRRDLTRLENAGLVERNYGGVILRGDLHTAAPFMIRGEQNRTLKKEIAAKASSLLRDNVTVLLDDSTTAFYMLEHLKKFNNISLFTNNLTTAIHAIEQSIKTYMIGGSSTNGSVVMCGSYALDMLDKIYADICFFSSFALADNGDIYDCTEEANAVRRKMLDRSATRVFLCDSSKFHTHAAHRLCNLSDIEYVFSDKQLPSGEV
ncbi:MAG: DeoR/GlpR transcriptional regulator [Clostridia bacterium]|nr:DeoR/GlpR transcriptional regulator [Clostridia bacterium]